MRLSAIWSADDQPRRKPPRLSRKLDNRPGRHAKIGTEFDLRRMNSQPALDRGRAIGAHVIGHACKRVASE